MALVKFDPLRGFDSLSRKMNQLMEEMDKGFSVETGGFNPRVDIHEDEGNLYLNAELPGMKKENVKISVNDDRMLTIKGEKSNELSEKERTWIRTERNWGSFSRSFLLPDNVDVESIKAKFNEGVLEVSLAKKEPEKPKEINIEID